MTVKTDHYTAVIEIKQTTISTKSGKYSEPDVEERGVTDVARIVVRASDLEALRTKVSAHVALVEE